MKLSDLVIGETYYTSAHYPVVVIGRGWHKSKSRFDANLFSPTGNGVAVAKAGWALNQHWQPDVLMPSQLKSTKAAYDASLLAAAAYHRQSELNLAARLSDTQALQARLQQLIPGPITLSELYGRIQIDREVLRTLLDLAEAPSRELGPGD